MKFIQLLVTIWILFLMTSAVQFTMIALKIFGQIGWEWIYICSPFGLFILFTIFACIIKIMSLIMRKKDDVKRKAKEKPIK